MIFKRPILGPVLVGALLRIVAALAGYGFFASDDYTHVLGMAYTWLDNSALAYNSDIRSPLLARIVWLCFESARVLGASDPATLIRVAYVVLGLVSLAAIPGVYVLTERRLGEAAARQASWLMAVSALMPRIATRALISVVAMVPLVWGTTFADRDSDDVIDGIVAGGLLGLAAMFRYQVGIVCVVLLVLLVQRRQLAKLGGLLLGGGVAAFAQGLVDLATHGRWFASVIGYVSFNASGGSERYGTSPWFTYVVDFIALTLPPATIWLARPMWSASLRHLAVALPFAVFVIAHSMIPHKEEHFIFAVMPYFFVLLGAGLSTLADAKGWARIAYRWFWTVTAIAVVIVTVSDGHRSLTTPLLEAGRDGGFGRVYFVGKLLTPEMYLGRDTELRRVASAGDLIAALSGETAMRVRLIFEHAPESDLQIDRTGFGCSPPEVRRGDVIDRILVAVNPANRRRGEKVVIDCWR